MFVLQVVTRLVHFLYTGELVAGAGQLDELKSLARALGVPALLHQIAGLEQQLTDSLHKTLFPPPRSALRSIEMDNNRAQQCHEVGSALILPFGLLHKSKMRISF